MIKHALRHWGSRLAGHKVIIYTDNMAAKAFINRQRAPSSIHDDILQDIFKIATLNDIYVEAVYLPSAQNCVADAISRFNERDTLNALCHYYMYYMELVHHCYIGYLVICLSKLLNGYPHRYPSGRSCTSWIKRWLDGDPRLWWNLEACFINRPT